MPTINEIYNDPNKKISTRDFLKLALLTVGAGVFAIASKQTIDNLLQPETIIEPNEAVPDTEQTNLIKGLNARLVNGKKPENIDEQWIKDNGWHVLTNNVGENVLGTVYSQEYGYFISLDTDASNPGMKVKIYTNLNEDQKKVDILLTKTFSPDQQITFIYETETSDKKMPTAVSLLTAQIDGKPRLCVKILGAEYKQVSKNILSTPTPLIIPRNNQRQM